jgi:hypothetical protein
MTTSIGLHTKDKEGKEAIVLGSDTLVTYPNLKTEIEPLVISSKSVAELDKPTKKRNTILTSKLFVAEDDSFAFSWAGNNIPELEVLTLFDKLVCPQKYSLPNYRDMKDILETIQSEYESLIEYVNDIDLMMLFSTRFRSNLGLYRVPLNRFTMDNKIFQGRIIEATEKVYSSYEGSGTELAFRGSTKAKELIISLVDHAITKDKPLDMSLEEGVNDVINSLTAAQKDPATKGYAMVVVDSEGIRNPFFPNIDPQEKADWRTTRLYLEVLRENRRVR